MIPEHHDPKLTNFNKPTGLASEASQEILEKENEVLQSQQKPQVSLAAVPAVAVATPAQDISQVVQNEFLKMQTSKFIIKIK